MAMMYSANQNSNDRNDTEALDWDDPCIGGPYPPFHYPSYYLQSPSANRGMASEKKSLNSALSPMGSPCCSPFVRPSNNQNNIINNQLSRYACSGGSRVFDGQKKYRGRMPLPHDEEEEEEEEEEEDDTLICSGGLKGFYQASWICIFTQLILWLLVSMGVFILLFTVATRPRSPLLSVKKISFYNFGIAEGSDKSGVPTKVFSCSCNVTMDLDNRSEFFGVHLGPVQMEMSFAQLTVATGQGREMYVDRDNTMRFNVHLGAKRKAVYGAGPSMVHLLDSGEGLPLLMHIRVESSIRMVWDLVKPKFSHHVVCHILVDGSHGQHHLKLAHFECLYNIP